MAEAAARHDSDTGSLLRPEYSLSRWLADKWSFAATTEVVAVLRPTDRQVSDSVSARLAMLRHIAPAGAPIRLVDLVQWAGTGLSTRDSAEALRADIRGRFGARHVFLTSTGRAGMTLILRAMRRLAPAHRDEVIIPSYTCYSVAASAVKAGLRPRIVDISPDTLDFELEQLRIADFTRILAVVATNLYGLPSDLPALSRLASERGVFLIDDAAQAMGASVQGRPCGTWGDAGLFSFDKGKNISAIDGGVAVTNSDDLASALDREMQALAPPSISQSAVNVLKALGYFVMLRPWLYGIPARIPQLGLGRTVFSTDFPLSRPDPILTALGLTMLRQLERFTRIRRANASALLEGLRTVPGLHAVTPLSGSEPVYLRLPILLNSTPDRDRALQVLNTAGIGATGSYPSSLADVPELKGALANPGVRVAGGRYVASRMLTLPTHPFVGAADVARVITELRRGAVETCVA